MNEINTDNSALVENIGAFMADAELSRASMAGVLGVSSMTLKRWFEGERMMEWMRLAAQRKMDTLRAEQERVNLFHQLHGLKQREKVDRLTGVLYNDLNWR